MTTMSITSNTVSESQTVSNTLSDAPSHELIAIMAKSFTRHINRAIETSDQLMTYVKHYLEVIAHAGKMLTDQDSLNAEALMNFAFKITRYAAKIMESTRLGKDFEKVLNESNKNIETAWNIIDAIRSDISNAEKLIQDPHADLPRAFITTKIWKMRNTIASAISSNELPFVPITSDSDRETMTAYIKAFGPDNELLHSTNLKEECVVDAN